jgi:hypothetical protein
MSTMGRYARRLLVPLTAAGMLAFAPVAHAGFTERVSLASDGTQADQGSNESVISADGRFVAFVSFASNLVPSDTNGRHDVFVHDRSTGLTERVSVTSAGGQVSDGSFDVAISGDGRFVGFDSQASTLVSGDTNNRSDVFVHDRLTGTTERVSLTSDGGEADNHSFGPSLSADGRFVSFGSLATNLVSGDSNAAGDTFVRDRLTGTTERVSLTNTGGEANSGGGPFARTALSADGRFVGFGSNASNLVAGDTNNIGDIFIRDRQAGTTERVNVSSAEEEANDVPFNAALSDNGRVVTFDGEASNLVPGDTNAFSDIFVRDLDTGTTERVNVGPAGEQANGVSFSPSLNADGRFVSFDSLASNLIVDDTNASGDVFMRDRQAGTTVRLSVGSSGTQANGQSFGPSLNADGSIASFTSEASNLVSADTNGAADVFVRDLTGPPPSTPGCWASNRGAIIAQNGDRARFTGRVLASATGQPSGSQTYSDPGPADQVVMRSTSIDALVCDGRDASIFGQALVNGNEDSFQIDLHDGGGRRRDTYRILLASGYDSGEQSLLSGGVRIR